MVSVLESVLGHIRVKLTSEALRLRRSPPVQVGSPWTKPLAHYDLLINNLQISLNHSSS